MVGGQGLREGREVDNVRVEDAHVVVPLEKYTLIMTLKITEKKLHIDAKLIIPLNMFYRKEYHNVCINFQKKRILFVSISIIKVISVWLLFCLPFVKHFYFY